MRFLVAALAGFWIAIACPPPALGTEEPPDPNDRSPAQSFVCLDSTQVVVGMLPMGIPSDSTELNSFLWSNFINGPDSNHFDCLVWSCEKQAQSFVRMLVKKAIAKSLRGESLERGLAFVLSDRGKNAYLPISATYTTYKKAPA